MNADDFEASLRAGECYHNLRVPPGVYIIIRVDGRSFTTLTNAHYDRPFDSAFHMAMVKSAEALLRDFGGVLASTHSDEISLLLPRTWNSFDREVEKAVSVAAGLASAVFSLMTGHIGGFDGRVWIGATDEQVVDYYRWRQADAARGGLNSTAYWLLRRQGKSARVASALLHEQGAAAKHDLLIEHGINFNGLPVWQRRGALLHWETYQKVGHNPVSGQEVTVPRRRIVTIEPPLGEAYSALIVSLLQGEQRAEGVA